MLTWPNNILLEKPIWKLPNCWGKADSASNLCHLMLQPLSCQVGSLNPACLNHRTHNNLLMGIQQLSSYDATWCHVTLGWENVTSKHDRFVVSHSHRCIMGHCKVTAITTATSHFTLALSHTHGLLIKALPLSSDVTQSWGTWLVVQQEAVEEKRRCYIIGGVWGGGEESEKGRKVGGGRRAEKSWV